MPCFTRGIMGLLICKEPMKQTKKTCISALAADFLLNIMMKILLDNNRKLKMYFVQIFRIQNMRVMDGKPEYKVALVSFCLYLCGYRNSLLFYASKDQGHIVLQSVCLST